MIPKEGGMGAAFHFKRNVSTLPPNAKKGYWMYHALKWQHQIASKIINYIKVYNLLYYFDIIYEFKCDIQVLQNSYI